MANIIIVNRLSHTVGIQIYLLKPHYALNITLSLLNALVINVVNKVAIRASEPKVTPNCAW